MYLQNINNSFNYELEKLCRIFLPFEKIVISEEPGTEEIYGKTELKVIGEETVLSAFLIMDGRQANFADTVDNSRSDYKKECERVLAVQLYKCFTDITGNFAEWGILTGVRPAKLYSSLCRQIGAQSAKKYFKEKLLVSDEKISLCNETHKTEDGIVANSTGDSFSLYISVPFCPTRCSYCSFVSHSVEKSHKLIPQYVEKLLLEIKETAKISKKNKLKLRTIYIGGGTPTTLSAEEITTIMKTVNDNFDLSFLSEYTVEAGRPDTVTQEKLAAIMKLGATRISINPQTMSDEILQNIGRKHTVKQTIESFKLAREMGFDNINMDLIAGLPGDTLESFKETVEKVIELNPENVTVHTLSYKRASNLSGTQNGGIDKNIAEMVRYARRRLTENGILPYYMYRQSKTVGNLENVGYAKPGTEGLYNVYIMDETHTILACGASAVTKMREPGGNYIERVFNYKYPYEYIDKFDEILARKENVCRFYEKYNPQNQQFGQR